jgi:hypothetical protein
MNIEIAFNEAARYPNITITDQKSHFSSSQTILAASRKVNQYLSNVYGKDSFDGMLIGLEAPAKRGKLELNDSIKYFLYYNQKKTIDAIDKEITLRKKDKLGAIKAENLYNFQKNLIKITPVQLEEVVDNTKYNLQLLDNFIDNQNSIPYIVSCLQLLLTSKCGVSDIKYIKESNAYTSLPLELDGMNDIKPNYEHVKNEIQNPVFFSPPNTNITHYFNTYFEIITEGFSSNTPYHEYVDRTNLLHYSEKIYKPILFGVPFCFWGPENTLEEFKKHFGMTFNCPLYYCNVGYDLDEFCNKINQLTNLSYLELHNLYYEYFDEIMNNQRILMSYIKNLHI